MNNYGGTLRLAGRDSTLSTLTAGAVFVDGHLSGSGTITAGLSLKIDGSGFVGTIAPDKAVFDSSPKAPTLIGGYGAPYTAAELLSTARAIGELTLGLKTGAAIITSNSLKVDLASGSISDKLHLDGTFDAGASMNNLVGIGNWAVGTYTIMDWKDVSGGSITAAAANTATFNTTYAPSVGGLALAGRMAGKAELQVVGNTLQLTTSDPGNVALTWNNASGDGQWNFGSVNWVDNDAAANTTFASGDKVRFVGTEPAGIQVAGQSSATTEKWVQVSDMSVTGGDNHFIGGAITGRANDTGDGKLLVSGSGTSASFANTIDFEGGVKIGNNSRLEMAFRNSDPGLQGFITSDTEVAIDADGQLEFNLDFNSASEVPVYAHGGRLTGAGTVTAKIDAGDSSGYLMLTNAESDLSGTIEVTSAIPWENDDSTIGLILTNNKAAGEATIKLGGNAARLSLDFGPDDGSTINPFNNIVTITGPVSSQVDLHSGRISLGGLENYGQRVLVWQGAVLDFQGDEVVGGSSVNINAGGAVVGGDGGTIKNRLIMNQDSILEVAAGKQALTVNTLSVTGDSVQKRLKADPNWTDGTRYAVLTAGDFIDDSKEKLEGDLSSLISEGKLAWGEDEVLYYNHGETHEVAENVGLNTNQTRVALAVDSLDKSSALYEAIVNGGTSAQAGYVLDQVSGQQHTAAAGITREIPLDFTRTVSQEVRNLRGLLSGFNPLSAGDAGLGEAQVWVNIGYSRSKFDGGGGRYEADSKAVKAGLGLDKAFDNNWFAGAAILYSHSRIDQDYTRSEAEVNSLTFGLYGGREVAAGSGAFRFTAGTALTLHDIDTERRVRIATLDEKLTADYNGTAWQIFAEGAYGFRINDTWTAEPYLNLAYVHQKLDSFTEEGGLATLHGRSQTDNDFYTTLGGRFTADLTENTALELDLGWQHRFGDKRSESTLSFAQGSTPFTLESVTLDRNQALIGLGLKQNLTDTTTLRVNYNGALGSDSSRHGGEVMLGISF